MKRLGRRKFWIVLGEVFATNDVGVPFFPRRIGHFGNQRFDLAFGIQAKVKRNGVKNKTKETKTGEQANTAGPGPTFSHDQRPHILCQRLIDWAKMVCSTKPGQTGPSAPQPCTGKVLVQPIQIQAGQE